MTLAEIFPDEDYKFSLRFGRGEPAEFFKPTARNAEVLAERKHWLRSAPQIHAALLPAGEALLDETIQQARTWNGFALPDAAKSPGEKLLALGEFWEPDFLLLKCDADGEVRLHGGCICFPSSWQLSEKIGEPIEFIHGPVPGLTASIGPAIHKFLAGLKPGVAWLRHNWGLSRSAGLNQHPDRALPHLDATVSAEEVWLRIEHQALIALPKSGGILFGIRIAVHPLAEIKTDALATKRLAHALETMPEEMARYKNLATARGRIVELLRT